jgi:hypothetical protein
MVYTPRFVPLLVSRVRMAILVITDALNAIRRVLPSGVACTPEVCEQRYGPGFTCDKQNFEISTPKRFYKTLEKRELPVSKTPAVRSIELDGSTGTWEVDKGIYQGDSWDEATAKGIITGGIDLDTDTPLIEYELQGDLTDFSQGSVAIKEFDTASESDDDAEATDVTKVMQRCPYGYTANEFGFCQAVATDSDGFQIGIRGKSYALINPITDLIDDTPTIELSDSTGTWEIGDNIYQGDDWANASAKGEIVGGQKLNSESPIIEYKLYGNQDFVGVDDGVSDDETVVRRHDSTPTVKLYGSTGTWQVGELFIKVLIMILLLLRV